ncbi:MAG: ATP synthase F1 subunit gamma [Bacteroidales bacterium]|nr:ATP synthase F1 subunit gamma [Bacteroidales bacterium]
MPTLKEIKGRIASVQNTLKITSAMKLVSSAKLRKAQTAIESMRPYQAKLQEILDTATGGASLKTPVFADERAPEAVPSAEKAIFRDGDTVVIAMASNSSLCGGFNANAIAKAKKVLRDCKVVRVYSIGKKMADAMRKAGYPSPEDYSALSDHPSYGPASDLAEKLMEEYAEGKISSVLLVYNHFVSTGKQVPVVEPLLEIAGQAGNDGTAIPGTPSVIPGSDRESPDVILEPSRKELLDALYPKTIKLKLFAALLDSAAAEHAARTVAMQTATDNGEDLLAELTLQYNKGRQQKITSEILDLAGGQARE